MHNMFVPTLLRELILIVIGYAFPYDYIKLPRIEGPDADWDAAKALFCCGFPLKPNITVNTYIQMLQENSGLARWFFATFPVFITGRIQKIKTMNPEWTLSRVRPPIEHVQFLLTVGIVTRTHYRVSHHAPLQWAMMGQPLTYCQDLAALLQYTNTELLAMKDNSNIYHNFDSGLKNLLHHTFPTQSTTHKRQRV